MDTNMTFRMDSEVKAQMSAICAQLGMTTSTAFNIFANAFGGDYTLHTVRAVHRNHDAVRRAFSESCDKAVIIRIVCYLHFTVTQVRQSSNRAHKLISVRLCSV